MDIRRFLRKRKRADDPEDEASPSCSAGETSAGEPVLIEQSQNQESSCADQSKDARKSDSEVPTTDTHMGTTRTQLPAQKLKTKTLRYQHTWKEKYPWIGEEPNMGVLCTICVTAAKQGLLSTADGRCESSFISAGFAKWKKALSAFQKHEMSTVHAFAYAQLEHKAKSPAINIQLSNKARADQAKASCMLKKVITSIRYLARQGLALRGHEHDKENLQELLNVRGADCPDLKVWRNERYKSFTSWAVQNELLELMAHSIIRTICVGIRKAGAFATIVDGTTDITVQEQESIVVRYTDVDLVPHEVLLGFVAQTSGTSGKALSAMLLDVLLRLNLPLSALRGQTYDGASNMSGKFNGTQALIARQQQLALYVHCLMHAGNLVAQEAMESSRVIQDAALLTNEVAATCNRSTKLTAILRGFQSQKHDKASLRPLCPTIFLVRRAALKTILDQNESLNDALSEYADASTGEPASKARGLLKQINDAEFVVGLKMALPAMAVLENLTRALQSRDYTISNAVAAMKVTYGSLSGMRTDDTFHDLFTACTERCRELDLEAPKLSRAHKRRRPQRFETGDASGHIFPTAEEYYRAQYFHFIDTAMVSLKARYDQPGLGTYLKLEDLILRSCNPSQPAVNVSEVENVVKQYPELDGSLLHTQLAMVRQLMMSDTEANPFTLDTIISKIVSLEPVVRQLFGQVETFLRLVITIPCSSAEAERSFSGLRRLKTYLRNSMGQARLNHLAVLHVHQDMTDGIDVDTIAKDFIAKCDSRKATFSF